MPYPILFCDACNHAIHWSPDHTLACACTALPPPTATAMPADWGLLIDRDFYAHDLAWTLVQRLRAMPPCERPP